MKPVAPVTKTHFLSMPPRTDARQKNKTTKQSALQLIYQDIIPARLSCKLATPPGYIRNATIATWACCEEQIVGAWHGRKAPADVISPDAGTKPSMAKDYCRSDHRRAGDR